MMRSPRTSPPPASPTLLLAAALLASGCARGGPTIYPGTIEVNQSDAAPLQGGRIVEIRVDEGDSVRAGDTLAVLTQGALPAAVAERRARLASARARLADLQRGSRAPELEQARAELAAAAAEADRTARDLERAERLARDRVIAAQDLDHARTQAETAARRRDAAKAALDLAVEGSRTDQIRAAEADVRSAEAQLTGATADLQELAVLAAVDGVILGRHADPGEVIPAGTPVVTIGEVAHPWVRVYLPARLLAALPAGAEATVLAPGATEGRAGVEGRLGAIRAKAEFTPRAALTTTERADLLFAARIELEHPPEGFRPGLPVTVRFNQTGTQ
jgi:membrane fusion protein YbhG